MTKVFAEFGYGNDSLFSTEFEEDDGNEHRVSRFVRPKKINGVYIRVWIGTQVYFFSTNDGFETSKKDRREVKILLGVSGINRSLS